MRRGGRAFLLACALFAPAARADDQAYRACVGKAGTNGPALASCGADSIRRAEAALGPALKAALADMPGKAARQALVEEQEAWVAFRDKSCLLYAGGDFARDAELVSFAVCRSGVIAARTKYLERLTDN